MTDTLPIHLRAHTEIPRSKRSWNERGKQPNYPEYALIFDCETTVDSNDTSQALTFGGYRICHKEEKGKYVCIEEGLFFAEEASKRERLILREYVKAHKAEVVRGYSDRIRVLSRSKFTEKVFFKLTHEADGLVCGFNLPFDLSRIAADARQARRNKAWSLIMSQYKEKKTGRLRENPFRPRIIVTPKDSKAAFIHFTGRKDGSLKRGRFLDLRTLAWALRNESYSLESACEAFGVEGKLEHEPTGRITTEEIQYCRQDVRASVALLNAELAEFDRHQIDLLPDRAISSASIGKAYLTAMGVVPPLQKFKVPASVLGIAMQAYYGGRAECRIRHTSVPVSLVDFTSQYPTVNTLMGLWKLLTAKSMRIERATNEVRRLLAKLTLAQTFKPDFWKQLSWFALVRPSEDILPVRATYDGDSHNIGLNYLTSEKPIWYAGPDLLASALLTGKPPEIIRAIRIVPEGRQKGLKPIFFRGETRIDPRKVDFFKTVIEARARARTKKQNALAYSLKILANATSYGLFVEVNPVRLKGRKKIQVFSGQDRFPCSAEIVEPKGRWYFPPIAALITAAGRLLLAMLERAINDAGGTYLFADTDSMGILAKEKGGLVPCVGGSHFLPNRIEAVKALSWAYLREIVARFEKLNPYNRKLVPYILKIEKMQPGLCGYAISTKRYALYSREIDGVKVEKASEHALGYLYPPKFGFSDDVGAADWIVELWERVLREAESLPPQTPSWFDHPAMMCFTITTPEVLKPLQRLQKGMSYRDRTKPYNFVLSPILNRFLLAAIRKPITLITPFTKDPKRLLRQRWVNIHDGKVYRKIPIPVDSFGDIARDFCIHRENKSRAPDGSPCDFNTSGLLKRTHVRAGGVVYHGKETDRKWEQGGDISLLFPLLPEYGPNETARMVCDRVLQNKVRHFRIRRLAQVARVSTRTVKAARGGKRLRKSTVLKIQNAILRIEEKPSKTRK
jgi:hypothetical protein